jgi:hypothetical protein
MSDLVDLLELSPVVFDIHVDENYSILILYMLWNKTILFDIVYRMSIEHHYFVHRLRNNEIHYLL